jgi:hypothetical protein
MRDVAYELVERQDLLTSKLREYEKLITNAKKNDLLHDKCSFVVDIQMTDDYNDGKCIYDDSIYIFQFYQLLRTLFYS